ncbi:MAG TPA: hypothetical protein VIL41_06835 [Coriobacteriia bacterium]
MNERTAEARDVGLLSAAVVLGVVVSFLFSLIGLPLVAMGAAGLAHRGRVVGAAVGSAIGVAVVGVIDPASMIFVAPAVVAVLLAVVMLSRVDAQWVGAMLTAVFAMAGAGRDYVLVRTEGTTLSSMLSSELNKMIAQQPQLAGGSSGAQAMRDGLKTVLSLIPMMYFVTGLVTAVAVIAAIAWAAKRSGRAVRVPALSRLDFTPHVLWPFVVGLLALAASYAPIANAATWGVVGLNLVWCVSALFSLQGLGVSAGVLNRTGVGLGGRILAWAALAVLDVICGGALFSFIGLVDFWVNFRRLPRDGATPTPPMSAVPDR